MPRRPNLLFIFTDQQRRDTLSCYGNDYVRMPNLNRFAQAACVFDDAHCASPLCTPSRGCMMSGLYPFANGAWANNIPINADVSCLPRLLPKDIRPEYRAEHHGKWHLGDEIYPQHGFDRFVSIEDFYFQHFSAHRNATDRSDYHHHLLSHGFALGQDPRDVFNRGFAAQLPEMFSKARFLGEQASEFIRQYRDQPWLLTVSFLEPHDPFYSPRNSQYDPDQVPLFPNFDHTPGEDGGPVPQSIKDRLELIRKDGHAQFDLQQEDSWRTLTARYLGLCSLIDTQVGSILNTLRDQGLDDNTIVVFTSDHGEMMGSHHLLLKKLLYREAVRIPLLIRLPGQKHTIRVNGPVSHVDLVPTLLDLMELPIPSHLHGRSLAASLRSRHDVDLRGRASPCVVTQDERAATTRTLISTDGWRYSNYVTTGEHELYNLNADPGERYNLAAEAGSDSQLRRMRQQLRQWQDQVRDTVRLTELPGTMR